jgi:hypothetical protein
VGIQEQSNEHEAQGTQACMSVAIQIIQIQNGGMWAISCPSEGKLNITWWR